MSVRNTVKSIQDIMRQDTGVDGDAQRISQLCWMFFLKIIDDQDEELELLSTDYRSPVPAPLQWRTWAADPEGATGETLMAFVNSELFPALKALPVSDLPGDRRRVVRDVFEDAYNYMKSGQLMRQVIGNVRTRRLDFTGCRYVSEDYYASLDPIRRPRQGDVLYTLVGSFGIPVIVADERPFCVQRHIGILRPSTLVETRYLAQALESEFVLSQAAACATGIAQKTVPLFGLRRFRIPLPPVAEQCRIVAKVDELMALCDRLEAAQAERERRRDHVTTATVQPLSLYIGGRLLQDNATASLQHLGGTVTKATHIAEWRETILTLAVRGLLVSQDPDDEPVPARLEAADHARAEVARTDRRADRQQQPLLAGEDRWTVPSSWQWRGLADLVLFIDYRGQTPTKVSDGVRLVTAKNVKRGLISLTPEEFISEPTYRFWMTRGFPRPGDVLFTTEAPMGNVAVARSAERFALAQRVICFRSYGAIDPDFLVLQILAAPFQSILDKTATGLTAKGIKGAKLKRLPVAIPPLAEQRRIVAKVDELMAICDRLEAQLTTAQTASTRLLEAVLQRALAAA